MFGPAVHERRLGVAAAAGEHLVEPPTAAVLHFDFVDLRVEMGLLELVVLGALVQA